MSDSLAGVRTWDETLAIVSGYVREAFHRSFPLFKEDEVPPHLVALRDAFYAFPVQTDVLLIESGRVQPVEPRLYLDTKSEEGPIWTLIAHHVGETPGRGITFHGVRLLTELDKYSSLLKERFGFRDDDGSLQIISRLKSTGFWDYESLDIVDFIPFDVRERPEAYGTLFAQSLLMDTSEMLIPKFKREIDYNAVYGLQKDLILSPEEWTKIDPTTALFVNLLDGKPPTFQERQEAVCDIQLIPKVPRDIQLTFQRAKDIYVAGYFRYDFYTIAVHYAALAIEAAIKARWTASLPQNVTIACGGKTRDMAFPSHTKIFGFLMKEKWDRHKILVDEKPFPASTEKLLDWLERERVVTKWERGRLRIGLNMRNALSHVEHSSTNIPSSNGLRFAARLINTLFHSLP
jgi:hypothetical protein